MSHNEELQQKKIECRRAMTELRDAIPKEDREAMSRQITDIILQTEMYQNARYILTYVSCGSEVATIPLIRRALKDEKQVYVPRIMGPDTMRFFRIRELSQLTPGTLQIPEPEADPLRSFPYSMHLSLDRAEECVFFVPGLAFDEKLNRLGMGRAYYDRYLKGFAKKLTIGLAFPQQIIGEVPADEEDVPMDIVVTPERAYF